MDSSRHFLHVKMVLRQGENLSPVLFSIFLNDLENFLSDYYSFGLFFFFFFFFQASSTKLFKNCSIIICGRHSFICRKVNELQELLNEFHIYCKLWKLDVNTDKSKIVIFGDRTRNRPDIIFDDKPLEVLDSFKYLGLVLPKSRNSHQTENHVAEQARKG